MQLMLEFLRGLWKLRQELGPAAVMRATEKTPQGKLQTLFEKDAVDFGSAFWLREQDGYPILFEAEGWDREGGLLSDHDLMMLVSIDPVDGTAGDVGHGFCGQFDGALPVSTVIAIRDPRDRTFGGVKFAGALDLHTGQIFLAGGGNVLTVRANGISHPLTRQPQYHRRNPMIAGEFARRALWPLRYLIPYGVTEFPSDSHSSFISMLKALVGELDIWLNIQLPGIKGAGQRGHELGAAAVFARELGACVIVVGAEESRLIRMCDLDEQEYTFDGQTSVILAVDKETARHYFDLINAGLERTADMSGTVTVADAICQLQDQYPDERFAFRELPKQ